MLQSINAETYMQYIRRASEMIKKNGDYISRLDAETGDGDHFVNINMGFDGLLAAADELSALPMDALLKKIGMILMSKVGGSSGVLYGGAYMAAGTAVSGKESLSFTDLCTILETMVQDMMKRGQCKPGYKTMIDTLYPAVDAYQKALTDNLSEIETFRQVKDAALRGMEKTKNMEAVKGRASYRTDKGVGFLDPGAVTMYYQLASLCDLLMERKGE